MTVTPASQPTLLDRVYVDLGLDTGRLFAAAEAPRSVEDPHVWRDVGEWLMLAHRAGVDQVFFVGDDPVLVFSALGTDATEADLAALYRRVWSMARPRRLFVDLGGELRVYVLDTPPPHPGRSRGQPDPLAIVKEATEVQTTLGLYHEDRFASGAALEDLTSNSTGRADRRLLRDVEIATTALIEGGMPARSAHSLIERAILIRYLEDRGVLTEEYFEEIPRLIRNEYLTTDSTRPPNFGTPSRFVDVLNDPELTRSLFARLADDFNGDLFVDSPDNLEPSSVQLMLLRDLLTGVAGASQEPLFLWAYDFAVVPTSLVSTMYELFYNQTTGKEGSNTHYTPPELVEFIVADALPGQLLNRRPAVCDPACGSGIFLVEAYRRLVRHASADKGRQLTSQELRSLLLERLAGCDIDVSAIRLAAFSLYIAFLNYQTPSDILQAGPLPPLIRVSGPSDANAPLVVGDAFWPLHGENPPMHEHDDVLPWTPGQFDVVFGNPPWSEPRGGRRTAADRWATRRGLPVGDRSPSQQFLWRSLDLLAPGGTAAMLVSVKVLFNTRSTSRAFRRAWLKQVQLQRVMNFSAVRRDFFAGAVAPFVLLRFTSSESSEAKSSFVYETARPVAVGRKGSASLSLLDRRRVDQSDLAAHDYLWKTYSAGNHRDRALVERLGLHSTLRDLMPDDLNSQYGYQRVRSAESKNAHPTPESWSHLDSINSFTSWGPIEDVERVPPHVKFAPDSTLFLEPTVAVSRLVSPRFGPHVRLLDKPLAFRHTYYGLPFGHRPEWQARVAVGLLLSSVGRYWLYMVSGSWGSWKDEVRAQQLLDFPMVLDSSDPATTRMVQAVDSLPLARGDEQLSFDPREAPTPSSLLEVINQSAFDLFRLSPSERDLVEDFWAARNRRHEVPIRKTNDEGRAVLERYDDTFRSAWKPLFGDDLHFSTTFHHDPRAEVLAAVFRSQSGALPSEQETVDVDAEWQDVLASYAAALAGRAKYRMLERGEMRVVTDSAIIVAKRNAQRYWSASAARDDADAAIAQLLALQATKR